MSTIRSSAEIDRVFKTSNRVTHRLITVLVSPTPPGRDPMGRVAFIAGKKTGNAVARNRAKRVLREAARAAGGPWAGHDVLLIARSDTGRSCPCEVATGLRSALRKAGLSE